MNVTSDPSATGSGELSSVRTAESSSVIVTGTELPSREMASCTPPERSAHWMVRSSSPSTTLSPVVVSVTVRFLVASVSVGEKLICCGLSV